MASTDAPSHLGPRHGVGERELEPALLLVLPGAVRRRDGEQCDSERGKTSIEPTNPATEPRSPNPNFPTNFSTSGFSATYCVNALVIPPMTRPAATSDTPHPIERAGALPPLERERRRRQAGLHLRGVALADDPVSEVALTRQRDR